MGVVYYVIIRSHKVISKPSKETEIFDVGDNIGSEKKKLDYITKKKKNIIETYYKFNAKDHGYKRGLTVENFPIHKDADIVTFTNSACDEYYVNYEISFKDENNNDIKSYILPGISSLNYMTIVIPKNSVKLNYHVGSFNKYIYDFDKEKK